MSEISEATTAAPQPTLNEKATDSSNAAEATTATVTARSNATTPASSVTGIPVSRLKTPSNFGSTGTVSKIGRLCTHAAPKAGPPPRDTNSMSRESDDNLSSINSTYTDLYQETVRRFTRSSLSPEMDRYSPSRMSTKSKSMSQKSDGDRHASLDLYLEATGRRRSSDHGAVLTADTEQFIIGQKVWVGGIRAGQIAYIGETHFAPGDWAGVVLDEPNGKNDGCVAGKRYFQCEPKRGIFSRLTRLTLTPLPGAYMPTSPLSKNSPERSRTVSPTASIRSSFLRSPGKNGLSVGDRIIVSSGFGSRPGVLKYLGETQFASGNWCGVELDEASGKNDGSVDGVRYFECKPKYGVFVPIAKVSLSPSSKKSRLSRTGSRESLNSIGTMNSIATTNTSRMRMNAQRKSSSIKPVPTSPKTQFSMQDLLREKQNHIEQLMIERDLDREDAQNQALQFQKNISELKARTVKLERQLEDERKKAEDLQFSIDEATFCGDEMNAQTQVYQEKIRDLEQTVTKLALGPLSAEAVIDQQSIGSTTASIQALTTQVEKLRAELDEQATRKEAEVSGLQDESTRLQERIKYLQSENETLNCELLRKDESLEKFSISESGLENLKKELVLLKEENEKERQQVQASYDLKSEETKIEVQRLVEELAAAKDAISANEDKCFNMEEECQTLRTSCKVRDEELQELNEKLVKLKAELSVQRADSATLEELLKAQQLGSAEGKSALEEKITEIAKLQKEVSGLQNAKADLENQLQSSMKEAKELNEKQQKLVEQCKEATTIADEQDTTVKQLTGVVEELKNELNKASTKNQELNKQLIESVETNNSKRQLEESLRKELSEKTEHLAKILTELQAAKEAQEKQRADVQQIENRAAEQLNNKIKEVEHLTGELSKAQEQSKLSEEEIKQKTNVKITELENHIKSLIEKQEKSELALSQQQQINVQQGSELSELKSTNLALESTSNLFEKLKEDHEQALSKCLRLEEQIKQEENQHAQQQLEKDDLKRKFEVLNSKCEALEEQNEHLHRDVLEARTAGADVQTELRQLKDELSSKQRINAELQNSSDNKRIKMESQLEALQQKLSNADKDCCELKDTLQNTKTELAKKSEQLMVFEEKAVKLELAHSDTLRQTEQLQTKYDALAAQNECLQQDLTTLRTSSTDSNAELLKVSQDVISRQRAYEELLDKSSAEHAALQSQLQVSQQRVDALCNQVEALTQELKNASDESFKLCEQLKAERDKSSTQALELNDVNRKLESLNSKCTGLESENATLRQDLSSVRTTASDSYAEVVKVKEELASKQRALQEQVDKSSSDRLQFESQLQEVTQRLQMSQTDAESLRNELTSIGTAASSQAQEFEALKGTLQENASKELAELKGQEAAERQKIIEGFEEQLKSSEKVKITLDEAICSLQNQIKLLQDELLKSQLSFKAREEELSQQLATYIAEKEQLTSTLQQVQLAGAGTLNDVQLEKAQLLQQCEKLHINLKESERRWQDATSENEQLKMAQATSCTELAQLQSEFIGLKNALTLSNADREHQTNVLKKEQLKKEELKRLLEALQVSNTNISATNAELSAAIEVLEQEKFEMAHIFELFEMESDQNADHLVDKLSSMKEQLSEAQSTVHSKEKALGEAQKSLQLVSAELEATQSEMSESQSKLLTSVSQLQHLQQKNEELLQVVNTKSAELTRLSEVESQLEEYRKIVDEMDEASQQKVSDLSQLQAQKQKLEVELRSCVEIQRNLELEITNLRRKLDMMNLEKTREIVSLQERANNLQSINKLKQNGGEGDNKCETEDSGDSTAQINFLNSIIADMQNKNDSLKAKIEALETLPTDFTKPDAFAMFAKRLPAPRMFCDICDEFDKHETEDCPIQASSDSPPPRREAENNDATDKKERKLPEPRKYCVSCEVFGHEAGECDDECF